MRPSLIFAVFLVGSLTPAVTGMDEPILRQPEKPAWEVDITDALQLVEAPDSEVPEKVASMPGVPYGEALSRKNQSSFQPEPEKLFWWKGEISLPEGVLADRALVLDFDEVRMINGLWLDGKPLKGAARRYGGDWSAGEGSILLPLDASFREGQILFRAGWLTQMYPNGFGRIRLRPATLGETLMLNPPAVPGGSAVLKNLGGFPLLVKARTERLDYFGGVLGQRETEISLEPAGTAVVPAAPSEAGDAWKARYAFTAPGAAPLEFWSYFNPHRENWERSEVVRLERGWEYVVVQQAHGAVPPKDGWKPANFPHSLPPQEWNSHWMWYRGRVTIPETWQGRQAVLWLAGVKEHARIYADGKLLADKFSWDLPASIPLPGSPGASVEVTVAVTDYSVGLAKSVPIPTGGDAELPQRGLAAPISKAPPGIVMVPELLGIPPARVAQVILRPKISGGLRLEGELVLENAGRMPASLTTEVVLLDAGRELSRASAKVAFVPPGKILQIPLPTLDCSKARPWDLDTPNLYELRVDLKDPSGKVVDSRRERVGFREIGVSGDHFTVNGRRLNLFGGSHVLLGTNLTWPVSAVPYRIHRQYYPGAFAMSFGRFPIALGDELGYLVKCETPGHDALHQSKYAYQEPEIWERAFQRILTTWRELGNHASIALWDVGNELWFGGAGEDEKMAALYKRIEAMDPTRLVVNGGGYPNWIPGARVQDWHGWPNYNTRQDWFFYHPEDRPHYQKTAGVFVRGVEGQAGWTVHKKGPVPTEPTNLVSLGNPPILFSEGHYYENGFRDDVGGASARVPLPGTAKLEGFAQGMGLHALNWLASRRLTVQNARVAGFASTMIHVDRGVGRWLQPLAAFSQDRRMRFESGGKVQSRFLVSNDMTLPQTVTAKWTLWKGAEQIGSQDFRGLIPDGAQVPVDLDMPLPAFSEDTNIRLHVEVWADESKACFRDDFFLSVFAPVSAPAPSRKALWVFDPKENTIPFLKKRNIPFQVLRKLAEWKPEAGNFLLIGTEALRDQEPVQVSALGDLVRAGGEVVVLDHVSLPSFLQIKLVSKPYRTATMKLQTPESPAVRGLLPADLTFWKTSQQDWISSISALEVPATGMFQTIAETEKGASLLEVAEGGGRVLFSQMNLGDALGEDPAAERLLKNLLEWPSSPRAFPRLVTLIVASDQRWLRALRGRLGVEGTVTDSPDATSIGTAKLIFLPGTDPAARAALEANREAVKNFLQAGGTLFVQGIDAEGASWLSALTGKEIQVEPFGMDRAFPIGRSRLLRGLDAASFYWGNSVESRDVTKPIPPEKEFPGQSRVVGSGVVPLLQPAFLAEVPLGGGRVVISTLRALDYPVRKPLIALSTILANAGAQLTYGGISAKSGPVVKWEFSPVDMGAKANHPLTDDPAGRRGWHMGGDDNDMRMFPVGRQTLGGVDYLLTDPAQHDGNGVIVVAGGKGRGQLPSEVKGIKVDAKAERLYFLHNSAWGVPGFTYRVYYKEDRAKWIPGQPDPFVDVVVKPGENIADWWGVEAYERGDAVLNGASLAWSGQNPRSKSQDRKVGVFQMSWDNPHPEKTIESIDILSPGTVGDGQAFIFGISTANKKSEP